MSPRPSIAHYRILSKLGEGGMGAEFYVRAYPGRADKWPVPNNGGPMPAWSRTKAELLHPSEDNTVMAAIYAIRDSSFVPGKPRLRTPKRLAVSGLGQTVGRSLSFLPSATSVAGFSSHRRDP